MTTKLHCTFCGTTSAEMYLRFPGGAADGPEVRDDEDVCEKCAWLLLGWRHSGGLASEPTDIAAVMRSIGR